jgi:hypothetical protein
MPMPGMKGPRISRRFAILALGILVGGAVGTGLFYLDWKAANNAYFAGCLGLTQSPDCASLENAATSLEYEMALTFVVFLFGIYLVVSALLKPGRFLPAGAVIRRRG